MCERGLEHKCSFREDNRLLVIGHDYYGKTRSTRNTRNTRNTLNSSLNDITIVWNYFRRKKCLNKQQIYIYGELDLNGKMLPWKSRYFEKAPSKDLMLSSNYIYYTGHGYDDGTYDDYNLESSAESLHIVDCCYSYLWDKSMTGMMASTDGKKSFISISVCKASIFTMKLFELLNKIYYEDFDENLRELFENFFKENNFSFKGNYHQILI